MLANHVPTFEEMTGWLEERETALSDLLGELTSAQWRGDDKHDQVCDATRNIIIVRTIQQRLHATTAPLTPTGEALVGALREIETICTESAGACRKRMGTRVGNALTVARAALAKLDAA